MSAGMGEDSTRLLHSELAGLPEPHCHVPPIRSASARRFGLAWLLTPLLWALAWPFLSLLWLNRYDHRESAFIDGLYERKEVVSARKALGPDASGRGRVVIIGGSASLIGIDAELLEAKLGRPTVNFGTHAALRLDYLLYRARRVLRPGDAMLFCPEYELWRYAPEAISDFDWTYAISYDKRYFLSLDAERFVRAMYSVPLPDYGRSASGWRRRFRHEHHHTRPLYDLSTLSPNGDLRATLPRAEFGRVLTYPFPDVSEAPSGRIVREFGAWAKAKGVRLLFCFPNTCTPENTPGEAERAGFEKFTAFLSECGFTMVDRPQDAEYPRAWFADTQYHPDAGCRLVRTESLIRRLRPHLGAPAGGAAAATAPDDLLVDDDDPALPLLEQRGWRKADVRPTSATFTEWVARYDRHLFLVAGASSDAVPPALRNAAPSGTPFVAAVGAGAWSHVRRVAASNGATIMADLRSLTGRDVPQLLLEIGAGGIRVNRRDRVPGGGGPGIAAVVIDPELGVVVDAARFPADGSPAVVRRTHRLVAAAPSP